MDSSDRNDQRTFRVNFSGDGAAKLRERVRDKLKEFMGDYTDDTLVEYVIVLLRNGRQKEEAKKELNVFLGDDSYSFVDWLWNHLSSNLNLYMQPQESSSDEKARTEMMSERNDSQSEQLGGSFHSDSNDDREKSVSEYRSRRNRQWKGLVKDAVDPPPLRSSEIDDFHSEKPHCKSDRVNRERSPRSSVQRKRRQQDEQHERQPKKREVLSHRTIDAPRRLLQFAVRDAVGTSHSSTSRAEPVSKRLRSVVSTSTGDATQDDRSKRMRSVASVPHAVATAIKAAAEAAEDAIKVRCSGNVFDRLGRGMVSSKVANLSSMLRAPILEDADHEDSDQMIEAAESRYFRRSEYRGKIEGDLTMLNQDTGLASDSASDNEGYDDVDINGGRVVPTASSGKKDDDSLMVQYSVANDPDEVMRKARMKNQDTPAPVSNASSKIVNISVNVNTWKPPHYKSAREVTEIDNRVAVQESEVSASKHGVPTKESNIVMAANVNEMVQKEVQKTMPPTPGLYSTVRPSEDADSRTIFVNNVHFAATKDTLSRHFNKFGEVLKVVVVTDAATGQPKGSAYIEFMRKEAAEHALSLNGTSFMSRILKVVRRGAAHNEVSPLLVWPRMHRSSPFGARFARVPFPRAIPNAFRARLPIKTGARSLQWKRGAQIMPTTLAGEAAVNLQNGAANFSNKIHSPTKRNLTYVRAEQKQEGNIGPA